MQVKSFAFNPLQTNTYLLTDEKTKETIIIDPACYSEEERGVLSDYIKENQLKIVRVLNTHLHFDHIYGNRYVQETYGVGAEGGKEDVFLLNHFVDFLALFQMPMAEEALPLVNILKEGDVVTVGEMELHVLRVPGHSPGSLSFYDSKHQCAFIGDVILSHSIGRTDLYKGNLETLLDSIRNKILTLPDDTVLYSGHGAPSSLKEEKACNLYLHNINM